MFFQFQICCIHIFKLFSGASSIFIVDCLLFFMLFFRNSAFFFASFALFLVICQRFSWILALNQRFISPLSILNYPGNCHFLQIGAFCALIWLIFGAFLHFQVILSRLIDFRSKNDHFWVDLGFYRGFSVYFSLLFLLSICIFTVITVVQCNAVLSKNIVSNYEWSPWKLPC